MTELGAIIKRFPEHELAIRRLSTENTTFLSSCDDYEAGAVALRLWSEAGAAYAARAKEYQGLLEELEVEILKDINIHLRRISHRD